MSEGATSPGAEQGRGLPRRDWLPEGFRRLRPGVAGGSRYELGLPARGNLTLVLLPGIEGDARVFCRLVPLAARWGVVAMDLPPVSAPDVDALSGVLDADLPAGQLVLVGASLGGLVARCVAARWPQRVRGLVTFGSLPHPSLAPQGLAVKGRLVESLPDAVFKRLYRRRIRGFMEEEGVDPGLRAHLLDGLPPHWLHRDRLRAIAAWGVPPHCAVPTLSLKGQVDWEAPWRGADVARLLPDSGFETVPGGHRAHLTHAEALSLVLRRFVESVA